jgi:hypothetical protein
MNAYLIEMQGEEQGMKQAGKERLGSAAKISGAIGFAVFGSSQTDTKYAKRAQKKGVCATI